MINIYKDLSYRDEQTFKEIEALILKIEEGNKKRVEQLQIPIWVNTAKEYLLENWNKTVGLEELAALCGVHKVTISKYFPKYVGSSLRLYQRKVRIIRAIELIRSKKYSLTEVAFLCGFADQSHFTRFFRQTVGCLPKELPMDET